MQPTKVLNGSTGFAAKCFGWSVMLSQLAFDVGRAMNRKQEDEPVFDASTQASLEEVFGDSGVPTVTVLNVDELITAHAAAFIMLRRCLGEQDPETGRRPEHLVKRLVPLPDSIVQSVSRLTSFNLQQGKAEAAKLGADFSNREAAILAEAETEAKRQIEEVKGPWIEAIKLQANEDTDYLIGTTLDAMVNAGRVPTLELRKAADLLREAMKKRVEAGGFAKLDASIYALCTAAIPPGKPSPTPANEDTAPDDAAPVVS
jgi:hypothetical protein